MKSFDMLMPKSLDEAVAALSAADSPGARRRVMVYAGGQDLLGEMKEHLEEPEALVNLKSVPELDRVTRLPDGGLEIGALVTLSTLEEDPWIRERFAMLAEAAESIASPQIRSAGTVGGNLCQRPRCWYYRNEATPCLKKGGEECFSFEGMSKYNAILGGGPSWIVHPSDLAPALVSYGASVTIEGPAGVRTESLEEFYTLPSEGDVTRETTLLPDEILTRVTIPGSLELHPQTGPRHLDEQARATFMKVRERGAFDFALSAVAVAVWRVGTDIRQPRVTLGGVAPTPWRARRAEQELIKRPLGEEAFRAAADAALFGAEPLEHNEYKIPMTKGLVIKALRKVTEA